MRYVFHPEAGSEFEDAVRYYKQRGHNLGQRLRLEVRRTVDRIVQTPERWRVLESDVRRCLVRVFPYSVLYAIEPEFILIIAIAHHKQAPGYWKHRLATRPKG